MDFATLKTWADQSRVLPETVVIDQLSGITGPARTVSGLFPEAANSPAAAPPVESSPPSAGSNTDYHGESGQNYGGQFQQPPSPYPRESGSYPGGDVKVSPWPLVMVIAWCALALVMFFVFRGFGIIIAGFTIFDGIKMKGRGHPHGNIAIALAVLTTAIIGVGWVLRVGGGG